MRRPRRAAAGEGGQVDVLLVCTSGGHLLQLWSLRDAWEGYRHAWVVGRHAGNDVDSILRGEDVFHAHSPAARSVPKLLRNLALAWRLVGTLRPEVLLTTGAAVAVPFAWVAKLRGVRVVYIENLARVERPSLSCRMVAPIADRLYVQWPELQAVLPRARFAGAVFPAR